MPGLAKFYKAKMLTNLKKVANVRAPQRCLMLLLRIVRVIGAAILLLFVFTLLQIFLPNHAPNEWLDVWPYTTTAAAMMASVTGNKKSRKVVEQLLTTYMTSTDNAAKREILGAILAIAEGERRDVSVFIVRRVVNLALRGDEIAMQALSGVSPTILHPAIRSDSLFDRMGGDQLRLWRLFEKASAGDGADNARKLIAFGLGMRSILHLSVPLTREEQTMWSRLWQRFASHGHF